MEFKRRTLNQLADMICGWYLFDAGGIRRPAPLANRLAALELISPAGRDSGPSSGMHVAPRPARAGHSGASETRLLRARTNLIGLLLVASFFLLVILVTATAAIAVDAKPSGNSVITTIVEGSGAASIMGLRLDGLVAEVWLLARHYLVLLILHSIGYRGPYRDLRRTTGWAGDLTKVPWA